MPLKLKYKHRLMCGDSTNKDDVSRLMDGAIADMVFTDPPYGMNLDTDWSRIGKNLLENRTKSASNLSIKNTKASQAKSYKKVENDDKPFEPKFILDRFDCDIILWGVDYYINKLTEGGTIFVWNKIANDNGNGVSWSIGSEYELGWINRKARKKVFSELWSGLFGTEKQDVRKRIHPNQKPIGLIEKCLKEYGQKHKVLVDLFLGSGSTLIACEKTNRQCYGMEIDPHYCSVIIQRYKDFCGKDVVKAKKDAALKIKDGFVK